jgi:O-antigen/teichoic acid export membrane protein
MTIKQIQAGPRNIRLLDRVLRAGGWTLFGHGFAQLLRLVGNLLLTRLLFPEAFGLMAIVQSVLTGITMLSDVGVEQAIIQNKEQSSRFLNTAWTVQAIRGALIWVTSCILAAPVAYAYDNHEIVFLLPAIGLTALLGGLASTNIASANRNLGIASITLMDIGTALISLVIVIGFAWMTGSVWSLVVGNIAASALRTLASHVWLKGIRNRFVWHIESLDAIRSFGGWVFISTALTFLVGEGNRLLIAGLIDVRELAFFSLATALCLLPFQITQQVGSRVLFPAFSEKIRERPEKLKESLIKSRLVLIIPCLVIAVMFIAFGERLIGVLYDGRYQPVGLMLKILALSVLPQALIASYGSVLWAKGEIRTVTILLTIQLTIQTVATIVGAYFGAAQGLILGLVATQWLVYPFHAFVYARRSFWQPGIDLPLLLVGLSLIVVVFI